MTEKPLWTRDGKGSAQNPDQPNKEDKPLWTRDGKGSLQPHPKHEPHRPEFDVSKIKDEQHPVKREEVKKDDTPHLEPKAEHTGVSPTHLPKNTAKTQEPIDSNKSQEDGRYRPTLPGEMLKKIEIDKQR